MSEKERIGFVGVGFMGHGMAKNILEGGYAVTVLGHRNREPVEDLRARGAVEAESVAQIAAGCDVVFLCLPGSPQVEAIIGEILAAGGATNTIVDCSTSNPVSTRALAETCWQADVTLVDAPLARTPKEAWLGELDTMVGASAEDFERLKPIFDCWAARAVRVGDVGAGHTIKLLNNFVALGYAALYSEALAIGAKNGVDARAFREIIDGSRMDCGFFQTFMQYNVDGDRDAHKFTLRNAHKDMRYLVAMANESGIASNLSSAIKNGYAVAEAIGRGDDYVPMLGDVVAHLNGVGRNSG